MDSGPLPKRPATAHKRSTWADKSGFKDAMSTSTSRLHQTSSSADTTAAATPDNDVPMTDAPALSTTHPSSVSSPTHQSVLRSSIEREEVAQSETQESSPLSEPDALEDQEMLDAGDGDVDSTQTVEHETPKKTKKTNRTPKSSRQLRSQD